MQITLPELNPSAWSLDSIEGVVILLIVAFITWAAIKKMFNFLWMAVGAIFLIQFLYVLGQTSFNEIIPIASWFKYDIFSALAQLCVGTKLSEWLTAFGTWFSNVMLVPCNFIASLFHGDLNGMRNQVIK